MAPIDAGLAYFFLLGLMGIGRVSAIRNNETIMSDIALRQPAWPESVLKVANTFRSQLQFPVLFYLLILLSLETKLAYGPIVWLGWAFVASRLMNSAIHITTNNVSRRFYAFAFGCLVLIRIWTIYIVRLLNGMVI